jgi:uncharacterized protein (DUF58 family)
MTTAEILKKVRKIEIKARGLSSHLFSGEYHSAFKGRGMSFSEVREYAHGDDIRSIDWNVTARLSTPFVKVFEEERELTLMLIIDVSNSALFGSQPQTKRDYITEIAAVLAFSALTNNDKIGVLLFSDVVEKYIPPKKGKSHVLRIIRELLTFEPQHPQGTDLNACLKFLNNVAKQRTIAFVLSDFISKPYEEPLRITARKHDLIGIQVYDILDKELPNVGLIQVQDSENNNLQWLNTSQAWVRKSYAKAFEQQQQYNETLFKKNGAAYLCMRTDGNYSKVLQTFFKSR